MINDSLYFTEIHLHSHSCGSFSDQGNSVLEFNYENQLFLADSF